MKIIVISLVVISVFFLLEYVEGKQKISIVEENTKNKENVNKSKKQIRIKVVRTSEKQINIHCYTMNEKHIGELLASYSEGDNFGIKAEYAVHLEQILVKRGYRRKGIAKAMVIYLLREMLLIEKEYGFSFRKIYGEVGKGGSDDPVLSKPFYGNLQGIQYGDKKKLVLQWRKEAALDGLDVFVYQIVKEERI